MKADPGEVRFRSRVAIAPIKIFAALTILLVSISARAEFELASPLFGDGDMIPASLACERLGGDGLSPPLNWSGAPAGTKSFALVEHHYPRGSREGVDQPSYYWLIWNIPAETTSLSLGNKESVGKAGGPSKFNGRFAYVPPCSPPESGMHTYVITLYALDSEAIGLANQDDQTVDGATMMQAIEARVIDQSSLAFQSGQPRDRQSDDD